jgi:hypothetical protein
MRSQQELLDVLLFILSNNLGLQEFDGSFNHRQKDKLIMQIFHLSGLSNVQSVRYLLSQSDATAEAVVEKLFGSAIRSYDTTAIQLLLRAGINPNMPIPNDAWNLLSPLAITAYIDQKELSMQIATLLTAHGADPNSKAGMRSPLACAIGRQKCELVKFFLSQATSFLPGIINSTLRDITAPSDLEMVQILLEAGANIENSYWRGVYKGLTLIGVATQTHNLDLLKLLLF